MKKRVAELTSFHANSLRLSKTVMGRTTKAALHETNEYECDIIRQQWTSEECTQAVAKFLSRK